MARPSLDPAAPTPRGGSFSRRQLLRTTAVGLGAVVAWRFLDGGPAHAAGAVTGPAAVRIPFNAHWLFGPSVPGGAAPAFPDADLATVTLPHNVTPLSWRNWDPSMWERVWLYRKHFDAPPGFDGMRVFCDFEGALTGSSVTVNGHDVPGYLGGYLPFSVELTDLLKPKDNVLAVVLDSRFNLNVPPNRIGSAASSSVDFWQPGGIYRDVNLRIVPQVFIADVFAKPAHVLDAARRSVEVECTLDAAVVPQGSVALTVDLRDGARKVTSTTVPVQADGTGKITVNATLGGLGDIRLWDIDDPNLYNVIVTLSVDGTAIHDYRVRIGFREARFELDGFFLNGRRVKLFGLNRHQFLPFAGGAVAARGQRKDAEILRNDLNCNMVRCSHYPQAESFLDACDELGLLVWDEVPGWGYLGNDDWKQLAVRDVAEMIRRDRNHPSIVIWGARLNETADDRTLYTRTQEVARSLDDSRPTAGAMAGRHNTTNYQQDVFAQNDYSNSIGPDGRKLPGLMSPRTDLPYLVTEAVGTLSGPAIFYRRIDRQDAQQGQAIAHARVHNIAGGDNRHCGVLAWCGYDYESGSGNRYQQIKYPGVIDLFRVPKPGAAIYQSQVDPRVRPVIQPAFYWDFGPFSPVNELTQAMICSNLERLEVFVGGAHLATVTPDTTNYGNLPYPPSFVDFSAVDGSGRPELRIDGYLGSTKVASRSFSADPSGDRLAVTIDDADLTGDGADATRVVFRAVDRYGQPRPYVDGAVTISVNGPGVLVGDNPFAFADAGGVGAVWLRTIRNTPGEITVTVAHPTLGTATATTRATVPAPGGAPAPYGTLQATPGSVLAEAGGTSTINASFTNNGLPNLTSVELRLRLPDGWTAQATGGTSFTGVTSGQQVAASWQLAVPSTAKQGPATVVVEAVYTAHGERGVSTSAIPLIVPYASLAAARNNVGISQNADVDSANLDGAGNSYSVEALAAAGIHPGAELRYADVPVTWPDVPAGSPDNVVATGQIILLSGSGHKLVFLGGSSPDDAGGQGTIYYADGTTSTYTVTLDNWWYPPTHNEAIASMPYVNSQGIGGRPRGQRQQTVYVNAVAVDITPGKQVMAVTLPIGGVVGEGQRTSGMHVFAMGMA
ncbi:NEW3 domain-containing protein [Micromonospora yasonensis]|uniref:glycoside hydrolase family 2 TIM barrel-domain containing protein n=1 Tax=Micromonospora yasonensis TaxID=1128667 RepID=UPI0022329BB5|nr:glycoside hydrolase family 2 TIM barrel-domain containing protein [Micromonospora yasonensis]MCW3840681.1 NEW3 domain-containing protein [Micromonospora yasonensis]